MSHHQRRRVRRLCNGRKSMNENRKIEPTATPLKTTLTASAFFLAAAWLATTPAQAQQRGPLVLAKSSYFFIGGKIDPSVQGSAMVGQMYVEYMIPHALRHRYRVVMVPGGSTIDINLTVLAAGRQCW